MSETMFGGVKAEIVFVGKSLVVLACPCGHVGSYVSHLANGRAWAAAQCHGSRGRSFPHFIRRSDMAVVPEVTAADAGAEETLWQSSR